MKSARTPPALRSPHPRGRGRAPPPGLTVLFTALSGAGKSTLANALAATLRECDPRRVALLDGDIVRRRRSRGLGFSRAHRRINLRRTGAVAAKITRPGGTAVCALIAPYASDRRELRETVETFGGFVEVYVSTPLAICEARRRSAWKIGTWVSTAGRVANRNRSG